MLPAGGHEKRMEQVGEGCTFELRATTTVQIKLAKHN
jgi:hypothetical protein